MYNHARIDLRRAGTILKGRRARASTQEETMDAKDFGYNKTLAGLDYDSAREKVVEALKSEGFGVLTEIDVKATLKAKLDRDFRRYNILGACNPPLAHQALTADLYLGLFLPCNVLLFELDDGRVGVSFVNPMAMFKLVDNPALASLAEEVDGRLRRAFGRVA